MYKLPFVLVEGLRMNQDKSGRYDAHERNKLVKKRAPWPCLPD